MDTNNTFVPLIDKIDMVRGLIPVIGVDEAVTLLVELSNNGLSRVGATRALVNAVETRDRINNLDRITQFMRERGL